MSDNTDYRWPLLYKWGQTKNDLLPEEYHKLHNTFRDFVKYFLLMENTFGKNPYMNIYDWAEVHFWPLVKLQDHGTVKCPELHILKPLLHDAIRQSYNLARYENNQDLIDDERKNNSSVEKPIQIDPKNK